MENRWNQYHQETKERAASELIQEALPYVSKREAALDLGAGALVESEFLLAEGFEKVIAVDTTNFKEIEDERFTFIQSSFEDYDFPKETFDLVLAQLSLPFTKPADFPKVWERLSDSLISGAIFAGHFFGPQDTWSTNREMSFHAKEDIESLFEDFSILSFKEMEKEAPSVGGPVKHWHVFKVIARKLD